MKFLQAIGLFVLAIVIVFALALLFAFPTKWLVNYIFSDGFRLAAFGVAKIGVWRALALNYLIMTLFKASK